MCHNLTDSRLDRREASKVKLSLVLAFTLRAKWKKNKEFWDKRELGNKGFVLETDFKFII